jgi:thermopsin
MNRRTVSLLLVLGITTILLLSPLGVSAAGIGGAAFAHGPVAPALHNLKDLLGSGASGLPDSPSVHLEGGTNENSAPNPMARTALARAHALGVPSRDVFVPRAGATPTQLARSHSAGNVSPLYTGNDPAPIGLADYGLSANPNGNGSVVASILNTPSLRGTFDPNATGVQPLYPFSSTPDGYGVQLNAVTTNVSLFGGANYSFWTQNVVEYLAQAHTLILVTNIWNFSGGPLSSNVFYAHGPRGTQVGTEFYYAFFPVPTPVSYPFNLSLWMNNSVIQGRNAVNFTAALTEGATTTFYPYDFVIFNSTTPTSGPASLSNYTANGFTYNPIGLTDDFELILGGPGGGSQADLYAADANMTLDYWNSTAGVYQAVPSAFSYGGETGETVTGAYVGWQNASTGSPYGLVRTGPAMLVGLWNASGAPGLGEVDFNPLTPGNAWLFISPNWTGNFSTRGEQFWAPQETTSGIFWLAPGNYDFSAELSNYDPLFGKLSVTNGGVANPSVVLSANFLQGIYTPLWAWSNSQFAGISTAGSGTPSHPYQIFHSQTSVMPSIFGTWNDFQFPVFTGVFFFNTNASAVMSDMGPLLTGMPYSYAASTNALGYLLYNASNVALVNSTNISGWYSDSLDNAIDPTGSYAGNYYGTFGVVLWNSSFDLIANDTFETQTAGLSLFGGGNNTVWGNTFTMAPFPTFPNPTALSGLNLSLGVQEGENGDLVYNNAFDTTTTAVTTVANLYTGLPMNPLDTWNITPTPRSTVNHVANFPDLPLTGTIVGNATQGGNYWYDYGDASNPTGVLPYTEVVGGLSQILVGGDYYPLVPPPQTQYQLQFAETGLPYGAVWSVSIAGGVIQGGTATLNLTFGNGSYFYAPTPQPGYTVSPTNGTVVVAGAAVVVPITYRSTSTTTYAVVFSETGLLTGTNWSVTLNSVSRSSTGLTIGFMELNGSYSWTLSNLTGYLGSPASGSITVDGSALHRDVAFTSTTVTYTVAFIESGLPTGTLWSVTLGFTTNQSREPVIDFNVTPQVYGYVVGSVNGYTASPSSASVPVVSANATVLITFSKLVTGEYAVTFSETGLATGTNWSVALGSTTKTSNGSTVVFTELNDSYSFAIPSVAGYTVSPSSGVIEVEGASVSKLVKFVSVAPGRFALTFTESGLPAGSNWSVTIGGVTESSGGGGVVSFQEPNNTYTYQVDAVVGYSSTPDSGTVVVAGAGLNVGIVFTEVPGSPLGPTNSHSVLSTLEWEILAVAVILAILAAVLLLVRRRRGGATYDASMYEVPSTTASETEEFPPGGAG